MSSPFTDAVTSYLNLVRKDYGDIELAKSVCAFSDPESRRKAAVYFGIEEIMAEHEEDFVIESIASRRQMEREDRFKNELQRIKQLSKPKKKPVIDDSQLSLFGGL